MTAGGRSDRTVNWLLYAIGLVTALTLVVGFLGLREIAAGNTTLDAQRQSDRLDACREAHRTQIDDATVELLVAQAASDELIRRGFAAVALGDRDLLREVAEAAAPASARVQMALVKVAEATDAHAEALALSREDPKKFLARCPDPTRSAARGPEPPPNLRAPVAPTTTRPSRSPAPGRRSPPPTSGPDEPSPPPTTSSTTSTTTTSTTTTTTTAPPEDDDEVCLGPVCLGAEP